MNLEERENALKRLLVGARTACKVVIGIIAVVVITAVILLAVPYTRSFILQLLNLA